jgi:hypothetical protein
MRTGCAANVLTHGVSETIRFHANCWDLPSTTTGAFRATASRH